jgi:hypothetical protein
MSKLIKELTKEWKEYRKEVSLINLELIEQDKYQGEMRPTLRPDFVGFMDYLLTKQL